VRYFVTGATGFLGRVLVRELLDAGHDVVALVRDPGHADELREAGARPHRGDVTDKDGMRAAMEGADGVFHLAAWYDVGARNARAEAVNVAGTRNVLELVDELGVPRSVYTSSLAVFSDTHGRLVDESYRYDGPHLSEYDRTKWRAHYEVAEPMARAGTPVVIAQPGVIYGPGDVGPTGRTLRRYLKGRLLAVPSRTAYCWGHVVDTARALIGLMDRGRLGESYIVAGPPHALTEALRIAEQVTGIRAPRWGVAPGLLRALGGGLSAIGRLVPPARGPAELLRVAAGVTYLGDSSKARRELGFEPRSLRDGFREVLPAMLEEMGPGSAIPRR
jgi:nucleoside-diphosphate-sugar epimerase